MQGTSNIKIVIVVYQRHESER